MNIQLGDYIKFRAVARGASRPTAVRKVNGFYNGHSPTVRFHGYADFIVHPHEVIEIRKPASVIVCAEG